MTLSSLSEPLDQLASALIRLDHSAVEPGGSQLERLWNQIRSGHWEFSAQELEELRSKIRFCLALHQNAARFYAGWARLAGLEGAAYTPTGGEVNIARTISLALRG